MSKTILLADDSLTIQKVVELTFMDEDYEVVAVNSGDEAVAKLSELTPALVITDIHMPGVSGYEVCRQVKDLNPHLPVLLLVGTFEALDDEEVEACGADQHLKKPFDSQELLRAAESLIAGSEIEEEGSLEGETTVEPTMKVAEGYLSTSHTEEPEEPTELAEDAATMGEAEGEGEQETSDEAGESVFEYEEDREPASVGGFGEMVDDEEAEEEAAVVEEEPVPAVADETEPMQEDSAPAPVELSDEAIERIAQRVVERLSDTVLREVAWEVLPDLAEVVIKDRLRELESQVE